MSDGICCTPLDLAVPRSPEVDRLRWAAFTALRTGTAPTLTELAASTGQDLAAVRAVLARLVAAGTATIDGDLRRDAVVVGGDGLTLRPTAHQLLLEGQLLHTWCALDSVGIPAALRVDAVARTTCPTCGARIELVLVGGQPPDSDGVGWWPLTTRGPVHESFCPTASLFCSSEHLAAWRPSVPGPGQAVPLAELAERGRATWS